MRNFGRYASCLAATVIMAAAMPSAEAQQPSGSRSKAFAQLMCSRCHAVEKRQDSPHRDAPPFAEIAKRYPPEHLAEALAEGIMVGHKDMPVFRMTVDEIEAFLDYLEMMAK